MNTEQLKQAARPDIAQAIHDAAVSGDRRYMSTIESVMLSTVFMGLPNYWAIVQQHGNFYQFLQKTDEGRTYMLLVAEALS